MFQSESEAWLAANKLATAEKLDLDSDPYIPIYNQKKQGWLLYPRVATLEVKAMRSGTYMGKDNCEFNGDTARVTVYRSLLDQKCAFSSDTIMLSEYATKKWHTDKPYMFLAKIALGRALRHAFPDLFGVQITYEEAMCQLEFDNRPTRVAIPVTDVVNTGAAYPGNPPRDDLGKGPGKHLEFDSSSNKDIPKKPDIPARENSPKQEIPVSSTNVTKLVAEVFGIK